MSLLEDGAAHAAHATVTPMAGRHLLTFELSEQGDELSIHGDPAGLRLLAERLNDLAKRAEAHSKPSVDQLSTSVWAGNELSLEPQGNETRLVYSVRIVAQPIPGKK